MQLTPPQWGTAEGRMVGSGIHWLNTPGFGGIGVANMPLGANRIQYAPWRVVTPIAIDQLVCELVVGVAGGLFRFGLYQADSNYQPTTLLADSGQLGAEVADQGVKIASVSLTLQPGLYVTALHCNNGTIQVRSVRLALPFGYQSVSGSPWPDQIAVNTAFAAFANPGVAWNTGVTSSSSMVRQGVFCRVSQP